MAEANTSEKKPGFFAKVGRFFREVKQEIKKVVWPSKKKTFNNTLVVLVFLVLMGAIIALFDTGLGKLVELITGLLVK